MPYMGMCRTYVLYYTEREAVGSKLGKWVIDLKLPRQDEDWFFILFFSRLIDQEVGMVASTVANAEGNHVLCLEKRKEVHSS